MKRDFISIDDLKNEALLRLMEVADDLRRDMRSHAADLRGFLMGSLFLEPSTRTRLSFEAAMARLGGRVITSSDPQSSSSVKGETLADTVRIVDSYVDVTVLRHPMAGAAEVAARHASHSVINAGDGANEHPTQTLCDLYALRCERGRLSDLIVLLYGDLKYGRTVHSLSRALVRMGATVIAIAEDRLGLPDALVRDLAERFGHRATPVSVVDMGSVFHRDELPALWIGPGEPPISR
jgi:aspartate carbamoyltransferase catalytic subunit